MLALKPPKVVHDPKSGKLFYSTNYGKVNGSSARLRLYEKEDITMEMNKTINYMEERVRLELKKNRVEDDERKIVVLCGSTRFKAEFEELNLEFTLKGHIVLTVGAFPHADGTQSPEEKFGEIAKYKLDQLHKRKIDLADIVFFINKDGYMGKSTRGEYEYAMSVPNKLICWYDEAASEKFVKDFNKTSEPDTFQDNFAI